MAIPFVQNPSFSGGEISPALYGRSDLARLAVAATTMRNMLVKYTGGSASRPGTKFVGFSKQTGRTYPPRLIPFQFNVNQGLALEFGNEYMRVIQNGAFVTETALNITGVTRANPAVVTIASVTGGISATASNAAVTLSYEPGEKITLSGGTYVTPAILNVTSTLIKSLALNAAGTGYAAGNTIALGGGTQSTPAQLTVVTTQVVLAGISVAGAGGTPGAAVVTGTTGTGTKFQALVTIGGGGAIVSVDSISVVGSYTVNPSASDPVVGGALVGAELSVVMGIATFSITNAGVFTSNPSGLTFIQTSSSGVGVGASFRLALMGINAVAFSTVGNYSAFPANPVAQASTTGSGAGATFTCVSGAVSPYANGDWLAVAGVVGMTQINGQTYVLANVTATTFSLKDVYGNNIDSSAFTAYASGGTVARIYTLTTPYAEADLAHLKFTESRDVMSLCLLNQVTGTEYAPLDLARHANDDWRFEAVLAASTIDPPSTMSGVASTSGSTNYQYVVTAVNPDDGTESIASPIASITSAVNIAATAGTITLTWAAVAGVQQYNVYKATPGVGAAVPVGALFGFAGSAYGTQFVDTNIIADFAQVPPRHQDPFARGALTKVTVTAAGAAYTAITLSVTSATGSGASLVGVLVSGALSAVIIQDAGRGYVASDTIAITGTAGAGAAASLTIGELTGTYPSVPAYFQQRRVYANSRNKPDTYFMSQPGAYTNFDSRIPSIETDAIIGNPWATQINGIQQMLQMPGGLVVLSGLAAWQLTGTGGSSFNPQPITPSSQDAQPQAFNGCNDKIPAIKIDYDILYVQQKGSIVRNFSYQYYQNIYTGADLTLNSSHLFTNFQLLEWAWCEEPYKVVWAVRSDGVMLSLTYVKPQEVAGWARHDTNGLFKSVCAVTEPPVDALYTAVQRFPGSNTAYTIERMDNRIWPTVEDAWCVDCGLQLAQSEPDAILTASSAKGLGAISGFTALVGGTGYSANTTARIEDDNGNGTGSGAVIALTIVAGVITAVTPSVQGTGYSYPALVIEDPENSGSGASATPTLNNTATFTASGPVFGGAVATDVIRMGGGVIDITQVSSTTVVTGNIRSPIVQLIPNSGGVPLPAASGDWTLTSPVSTVHGLQYLAGATVTGLYDGNVLDPVVVPASGQITLPAPASAVTIGLGFRAQLQSTYLNPGGGVTAQGQRKAIEGVTVRTEASRGATAGSNQTDGSALSPPQIEVTWQQMKALPENGRPAYGSTVEPLFTGDNYISAMGGFGDQGQVAIQQALPLPLTVLSLVPVVLGGDSPEDDPPRKK